jgi:hypothetical protein
MEGRTAPEPAAPAVVRSRHESHLLGSPCWAGRKKTSNQVSQLGVTFWYFSLWTATRSAAFGEGGDFREVQSTKPGAGAGGASITPRDRNRPVHLIPPDASGKPIQPTMLSVHRIGSPGLDVLPSRQDASRAELSARDCT